MPYCVLDILNKIWYNIQEVKTMAQVNFKTTLYKYEEDAIKNLLYEDDIKTKTELYFTEEEKKILMDEYLGTDLNSLHYVLVREFLRGIPMSINETKKRVNNIMVNYNKGFIMRNVAKNIQNRIGLKGLQNIFGNTIKEDIIGKCEDVFIKSLDSFKISKEDLPKMKEEFARRKKDPNYAFNTKYFRHFNSYLATAIQMAVLSIISEKGRYENERKEIETFVVIDENGEEKTVEREIKVKGRYIKDNDVEIIPLDGFNYDEDDRDNTESNVPVEKKADDTELVFLEESVNEVFNNLTPMERILIRCSRDYCNLYGFKHITQNELAKIYGLSQSTISNMYLELRKKIGYSFNFEN